VELAVATGRPLGELRELDDQELATFVAVLESRSSRRA